MRANACVQLLSRANTPSRVWHTTSSRSPMRQERILPRPTSLSASAGWKVFSVIVSLVSCAPGKDNNNPGRFAWMNTPTRDAGPPDAKSDTLGGIIMLAAAALALLWANSPWAGAYGEALSFSFGPATLGLNKSLELWISDGLMAIFFLYVGLEIKREIVEGRLSSRDRIAL